MKAVDIGPNPGNAPDKADEINLLPPPSITMPLWRSLLLNLRERVRPEKLPPLHVTFKPVNVGMLLGDIVDLPWYRTVFTNLGDVISPETLPPLPLESQPVDVGELVSDQIQQGWWKSLVRNLADNIAPERVPPLQLTSAPADPQSASPQLLVPRWSALITLPKLPPGEQPIRAFLRPQTRTHAHASSEVGERQPTAVHEPEHDDELTRKARRVLHQAYLREGFWISLAVTEVAVLLFMLFAHT